MSFAGGDFGGVWHHCPMNHDLFESYCHFEHAPSFKTLTDSDKNLPNSAPFSAIKSRVNPPNLSEDKETRHLFYKTRMCAKFLEETCKNGEHCTFAHGVEDLWEPLLNWKDIVHVKDKELNDEQEKMHKIKIWKTKICINWETTGQCPFHNRCHFAHGQSELQAPILTNSVPINSRPFSVPVSANTLINASIKGEKEEKNFRKWKLSKKIAELYGDWLDGYVPPHLLFSNTES